MDGTIDNIKNEFLKLAVSYYEAQLEGDWKGGNRIHKKLMGFYQKHKERNTENTFLEYLHYPDDGVKLWAATFLLKTQTDIATKCLKRLSKEASIISNFAELVLTAFQEGDLII